MDTRYNCTIITNKKQDMADNKYIIIPSHSMKYILISSLFFETVK
jgi:hypothetical protein